MVFLNVLGRERADINDVLGSEDDLRATGQDLGIGLDRRRLRVEDADVEPLESPLDDDPHALDAALGSTVALGLDFEQELDATADFK